MSTTKKDDETNLTPEKPKPKQPPAQEPEPELPTRIPAFPPPDDGEQGGSGAN